MCRKDGQAAVLTSGAVLTEDVAQLVAAHSKGAHLRRNSSVSFNIIALHTATHP